MITISSAIDNVHLNNLCGADIIRYYDGLLFILFGVILRTRKRARYTQIS